MQSRKKKLLQSYRLKSNLRERDETIQAKAEMEAKLAETEKELIEAANKKSKLMKKEPRSLQRPALLRALTGRSQAPKAEE